MNEKPDNIIPFGRVMIKKEERISRQQEEKGVDIQKMLDSIEILKEDLASAEERGDKEEIRHLQEDITNMEDRVKKGIDALDDLDAAKYKMWETYLLHKQRQEADKET